VVTYLQIAENVWNSEKGRSQARILYTCGRGDDPVAVRYRYGDSKAGSQAALRIRYGTRPVRTGRQSGLCAPASKLYCEKNSL